MNRDQLYGTCLRLRGRLRQGWGAIAGDPIEIAAGSRDELWGRIRERRGISQRDSELQFEDFMSRNRKWWDLTRRQRTR
jgi:uncharacterized protein YjbJ (UPF0337 family)